MEKLLYQRSKNIILARKRQELEQLRKEQDIKNLEIEKWQRYTRTLEQEKSRFLQEERVIKPIYIIILKLMNEIQEFAVKNKIFPDPENKTIEDTPAIGISIVDSGIHYSLPELSNLTQEAFLEEINRMDYSDGESNEPYFVERLEDLPTPPQQFSTDVNHPRQSDFQGEKELEEIYEKDRLKKTEVLIANILSNHRIAVVVLRWGFKGAESDDSEIEDNSTRFPYRRPKSFVCFFGIKVEINHEGKITVNNKTFDAKGNWKKQIKAALSDAFYSPILLSKEDTNAPEPPPPFTDIPVKKKRSIWHRIWYGNDTESNSYL